MAKFDSTLNVVPTQTTASSPVVVDTSALAVAQLAEAFTGQFAAFKVKEKKQDAEDASNKVLAGVASGIQKLGAAAESGQITLSQARVQMTDLVSSTIVANTSLTEEISKIAASSRTSSGLGAGKSQAQLAQERQVDTKKAMVDIGWVSPDATDSEVNELVPKLQMKQQSQENLRVLSAELAAANADATLQGTKGAAVKAAIQDKMKTEVRTIAVAEHARISTEVQRLNRVTGTDSASRQDAVEQLDALEDSLRAGVSGAANAFLNQDEIDNMLSGVLQPISILRQRFNENRPAKWANDHIAGSKAKTDVEFFSDRGRQVLSSFSRNVGPSVVGTFFVEKTAEEFMGDLLIGKGGKGTEGVDPKTLIEADKLIETAAKKQDLNEEDQESLSNSVSGMLQNIVVDNALGRVNSPKDIAMVVNRLADPNVNQKVVSGELDLSLEDRQRGLAVIRDQYIDQLLPATNKILNLKSPIEGQQSIGESFDFNIENGVLVVNLNPESQEIFKKASTLAVQPKSLDKATFQEQSKAISLRFDVNRALKDMKQVVASVNKAARASATLNKTSKFEPMLKDFMTGLLGGEVQEDTPKKAAPKANPETQKLINELTPEQQETFKKLSPEQVSFVSSLSPEAIQNLVSLSAPQ